MEIGSRIGKQLSGTIDDLIDEWLDSSEAKLQGFHAAAFAEYDIGFAVDIFFTIGNVITNLSLKSWQKSSLASRSVCNQRR